MPKPRKRLVSLADTPYNHCISRCVRRAFLCGVDAQTGFDFSHRRDWIVERIKHLGSVFAIDLYAYAVMSNHYHIVVRINAAGVDEWSDREVAKRWLQLFKGPEIVRHWLSGDDLVDGDTRIVHRYIHAWRERLCDLSWFMRCLNESIARMANREDRCSGRFWEGRFKSQALLDERALLACMAYVDLNPIRAGLAQTPETSKYTSVQDRLLHAAPTRLRRFRDQGDPDGIPMAYSDYLQLVDWSGRTIRACKRGFIPPSAPPVLDRLHMDHDAVIEYLSCRPVQLRNPLGPVSLLRIMAKRAGLKFMKGMSLGRKLCPEIS